MTFQPDLLAGKVAVVTGGTTGIGAGIAAALGRLGARVVATGLGADAFRAPEGVDVAAQELDVTGEPGVEACINGLERLDILVNCAGVIRWGEEHRVDVFEKVLAVNLTGTMHMCSAARAKLKESNGCITNTASMLSFFGGGWVPSPPPAPARLQSPCVGQNPYYDATGGRLRMWVTQDTTVNDLPVEVSRI
ncbi:MAG: SDR family NAD(P)-dependent oxidoreductase [Microvirga sp.]